MKALRTSVTQRERERAERATLVQQESLVKAKAGPRLCLAKLAAWRSRELHLCGGMRQSTSSCVLSF